MHVKKYHESTVVVVQDDSKIQMNDYVFDHNEYSSTEEAAIIVNVPQSNLCNVCMLSFQKKEELLAHNEKHEKKTNKQKRRK